MSKFKDRWKIQKHLVKNILWIYWGRKCRTEVVLIRDSEKILKFCSQENNWIVTQKMNQYYKNESNYVHPIKITITISTLIKSVYYENSNIEKSQ